MAKVLNQRVTQDFARSLEFNTADYVNVYVPGGTAVTVTMPSGFHVVAFGATGDFSADFNGGTASFTAGTAGASSVINPTTRYFTGASFSLFAAAGVTISVSFYNR